jgi:hypothetical protein
MSGAEIAALSVSMLALTISLITLWSEHLSPFKLRILCDSPSLTLYKITPPISGDKEGKTWWIPSIDLGVSFYNIGVRPGEVLDLRIVGELRSEGQSELFYFYPKWIVDSASFQSNHLRRFEWLNSAVLRDWYPLLLRGREEEHLHVILECDRWEQEGTGDLSLKVEVLSSKTKWDTHREYSLFLDSGMFLGEMRRMAWDPKVAKARGLPRWPSYRG